MSVAGTDGQCGRREHHRAQRDTPGRQSSAADPAPLDALDDRVLAEVNEVTALGERVASPLRTSSATASRSSSW
ncbi:hypothetical protein [Kribbella sindirgiensis]|uniref:hypothetical protein n=1 Tax=Kribbella sindirgiensis TaxID=1124744 RepID=UPI001EDCA8CC|nr:hypothetical protein [Kribbella sindirgiensis]